jgi:hypothetical protein
MAVSDLPVKDRYAITNVHVRDVRVDGTGTSVLSARSKGDMSLENVDARNVGAVGVNNCCAFTFTPSGSEFSISDRGGNDGGGTTGPRLALWELPNTITCDDRPPVVLHRHPPPGDAWRPLTYRKVAIQRWSTLAPRPRCLPEGTLTGQHASS